MSARLENARTIAAALGLSDTRADALLDAPVLLTVAPGQARLADGIRHLLSRTLANIQTSPSASAPAVEVLVG